MNLEIVNSLDEKAWRDFVDQYPCGNIFHTPEMFQVFARAKGHRPILWAVVDENHYPLALLLPVQITLNDGIFYRWTTRAVAYGSVLSAPGPEGREALRLLLQAYRRRMQGSFLFTELRNLSDLSDLQLTLNECDFSFEDHMNYLIDLDQSEETLWHSIDRRCRQYIRTSVNKGTIVEEVTDRHQLTIFFQLVQDVYSRIQVPLAQISHFEAAFDILAPREMFTVFLARVADHYIGTISILMFKGRIIGWYGGSDRTFSAYHSGELLIWHILQWGKEHGFHVFDFGGGGKPGEEYGPRNFKAKFGGVPVYYGRNICIHSPLSFRVSKQIYSWRRRISLISSVESGSQHNAKNS